MRYTPRVLIGQLLDLVEHDLSVEVLAMVCGPVPLDKAPWLRDQTMRAGATSHTTPEQSRHRVETALRTLVRTGQIVETEPGRYGLSERVERVAA